MFKELSQSSDFRAHESTTSKLARAARAARATTACLVENLETRQMLSGDGISAVYFDNADLTVLKVKRVEENVDFNWGFYSPDTKIGTETFSARFTGKIQPTYSETYTFTLKHDDGVRLWVNNELIIDAWGPADGGDDSGTIALTAGVKVPIRLEYYEDQYGASVQLRWSSASQEDEVIPQSVLYSDTAAPSAPANLHVTSKSDTGINLAWNAAADDVGAIAYNIYRNGVKLTQVKDATTFSDTGLTASTSYTYTVQAVDGYNNLSSQSTALKVTTNANVNGLSAVYFDNANLTALKVRRIDSTINFNWGFYSPDVTIDQESWSARWTGKLLPKYTETYTFYAQSDDGIRVWVNNQLVIDNWTVHEPSEDTGTIALTAGTKVPIRVEYFDDSYGASCELSWSSDGQDKEVIPRSQLFFDQSAPATPASLHVTSKTDTEINLAWNAATDDVGVIAYNVYRDNVKIAQVTDTSYSDTGRSAGTTYSYTVQACDGAMQNSAKRPALAVTTNAIPTPPAHGLSAAYYDNADLTALKIKRWDNDVNFDWQFDSPDASIGVDSFSARWSGKVMPQYTETYTFYVTSDDGARLYVNNQLVVNDWTAHGSHEASGTIALTAGTKAKIRLEYYDNTFGASVSLGWSSASLDKELIPTGNLYPDNAAPSKPASLVLKSKTATSASLGWTGSTDDVGVQMYNIYRNGTKVGSTTGTTYNATGLKAGTTYSFTVRAVDWFVQLSSVSNALSVTTPAAAAAPPPPATFNATSLVTTSTKWIDDVKTI